MAKAADQFRSSDVTFWGVTALAAWAVAILGANLSGLIPQSVYGALHASRLEGTTLNQLRSELATLEADTKRLMQENTLLRQRFTMSEEAAGTVTQRVGALELSLPKLVEEIHTKRQAPVDPTPTGSIGGGKVLTFETDGGTVSVQQRALEAPSGAVKLSAVPLTAPIPPELSAATASPAVALGFPIAPDMADARWQEILSQAGTMLIGLSPVLAESEDGAKKLLVAGPLVDKATAIELCRQIDKVGVPCQPTEYRGEPVPLLN